MVFAKRRVNRKPVAKRRRFVRRRRLFPRRRPVPRGVSTIANMPRLTRHRYVQQIYLDPSADNIASYVFSCNNINRPDYANAVGTAGSHQPLFTDQMGTFYKQFTVVGSRIHVTALGSNTTVGGVPLAWGVTISPDTITVNNYKTLLENGMSRFKLTSAYAGSDRQQHVRKGFGAKRYFGITNIKDSQDRVGCTYDNTGVAAPYQQAYYVIWAEAMVTSSDGPLLPMLVTIDYTVLWSEPNLVAAS